MEVTKRTGVTEEFDVTKIKQVVSWACEGLDVNPLALEAKFDEFMFDGITTKMLQDNLIEHAKQMCSPTEPDWTFVAGRLQTMNRWAKTRSYDIPFIEFVKEQIELGLWTHQGFGKYSDDEINELGEIINQDFDLGHSYASVVTAESKYLMQNECIQHMFMGNAMIIASVEEEEDRMNFAKEVYSLLALRWISLASPWLSNLRNDGNISSCFIISINDDLDSIFDNVKNAAKISKAGGGLGIYLGKLRAMGSSLMGTDGAATGIIGWTKIFNDTAVYVNQAGKRKGAFTVALPIWHADISDFLDIQTEVGDQRKKAHDIKPQLCVPDLFMQLKDDAQNDWYTFCPYEVEQVLGHKIYESYLDDFVKVYYDCVEAHSQGNLKVVRKFKAKELWKSVLKVQFETGMPYIAYTCRINEHNPNKHIGIIPNVNLCTESFSVVDADNLAHTCNLASPVVGRIPMDNLAYVSGVTCHILDNGIDLTKPPINISKDHNNLLRTVGVGIQGIHDIIARENKSFLDKAFVSEVAEQIELGAVRESIRLAQKRGAYPAYVGSEWENGNKFNHFIKHSANPEVWVELNKDLVKYGIRNSQTTSPAPNTSTSIFMDAGAGATPLYSAFFYEDNKDGVMPVVAMHLKDNPLCYARDVTKYKPWDIAKSVGWMQVWIDTGISAEYIMDKNQPEFKAKWLWDTLQEAWTNKTKAVYYIRTIKKGESLVRDNDICVGCAA